MSSSRSTSRSRAARPRKQASESLHFEEGDRLRAMAGAGDAFFLLIEQELGVQLSSPGGGHVVIVAEDTAARAEAKRVLKRLYASLEHGLTCDEAAVRAALRMSHDDRGSDAEDGVIRVPRGSSLIARTDGQREYVRALKNDAQYDLIFGVGPAGTGKTLLAVAYGASLLVARKVEKLIITRPAVEAGDEGMNDRGQEDEVVGAGSVQIIGQSNDARQRPRRLDDRLVSPSAECVRATQTHDEVQAL